GAHEHVRAGLGRGVRRGRVVGGCRGELGRVVELEVPVHLVGGDVVQARAVTAHRLEHGEGPHDVRVDEGPRVAQGVVVVGLGREVDDDVGLRHERVDDVTVGDVALDELDVQPGQGLAAARVGE